MYARVVSWSRGLLGRKRVLEVRERAALAMERAAFDLMHKDAAVPAVLDDLTRVLLAMS